MLDDLFDRSPEEHDHLRHVVGFPLDFDFHVLELLLFLELALVQLLAAHADILLGVAALLLALPVEILLHPDHLLDQVFVMRLKWNLILRALRILLAVFRDCRHIFRSVRELFSRFLPQRLQLGL